MAQNIYMVTKTTYNLLVVFPQDWFVVSTGSLHPSLLYQDCNDYILVKYISILFQYIKNNML